jgi:hypothetical protein
MLGSGLGPWRSMFMLGSGLGPWRSMFSCVLICPRLFVDVFPFPPCKAKLIGDGLMKRQNGAYCFMLFFFSYNKSSCVLKVPSHQIRLA